MVRNEKAEFAIKILLDYAKENRINKRSTSDLSPLEQWLILRLYKAIGRSEQLVTYQYLITTNTIESPFFTNWFDPENHFNMNEGMVVYDLHNAKFTVDGTQWQPIAEDHL